MDILHDEDQLLNLSPLSGEFVGVMQSNSMTELEGNKLLVALLGSAKLKSLSRIILEV